MVNVMWCFWMPLDLQGHFGHLVVCECGPQSGYWFQTSDHLGYSIWWPLTWNSGHELKLWINSFSSGTMGLVLATSDPQWLEDLFICNPWIPFQMWGHFLPRKSYSPALLNHQIGSLRDGHKPPQPKAAKPDLWDPATSFQAHPGTPDLWKCSGTLDGFGGLTEVAIYPTCANSLWRVAVLATLIQGLIVTGWQATWLTYKQLKHMNSRYPRYLWAYAVEQKSNTSLSG